MNLIIDIWADGRTVSPDLLQATLTGLDYAIAHHNTAGVNFKAALLPFKGAERKLLNISDEVHLPQDPVKFFVWLMVSAAPIRPHTGWTTTHH